MRLDEARPVAAGMRDDASSTAGEEPRTVEAVLAESKLREWIDPDVVRELLQRHRQGVGDHAEMLWAVLVLARFLERWAG